MKILFKIRNKNVLYSLLFYIFTIIITSISSIYIDIKELLKLPSGTEYKYSSYLLGIMVSIVILAHFAFIEYLNRINKMKIFINTFFKLSLLYCILSDFLFLIGVKTNTEGYFIGNKFTLSYMHLYLCTFFYLNSILNHKYINRRYLLYILFAIIVSICSECSTALIGCIILLIIYCNKLFFIKNVFKTKIIIICLTICTLLPLYISSIVNFPPISYIIINILGEDLTLTGRVGIYETLGYIFPLRPLLGFGIGNCHNIMQILFGTANSQNGIANLYIEQGILGVCAMLFLTITCLNFVRKNKNINITFPIYAMVFTLIIISSVEITIDAMFVIILSFLLINKNNINSQKPY